MTLIRIVFLGLAGVFVVFYEVSVVNFLFLQDKFAMPPIKKLGDQTVKDFAVGVRRFRLSHSQAWLWAVQRSAGGLAFSGRFSGSMSQNSTLVQLYYHGGVQGGVQDR